MSKHLAALLNGILGAGNNRRAAATPTPRVGKDAIWRVRPKTDVQASARARTLDR